MRMALRACLCVLLAALAAGCTNLFAPPPPPPIVRVEPAAALPLLEQRIFELVEQARQEELPEARPLAPDGELTAVARLRSDKMAAAESFADTSGDPHVSASLLMERNASFQGMIGENVAAQHFVPGYGIDVDDMAKRFVIGWMDSPQNRETLLFAAYKRGGIGLAATDDTVYATLLLAADLPLDGADDSAPGSQGGAVAKPPAGKDDTASVPPRGAVVP